MKKFLKCNKDKILLVLFLILFAAIFFSYNIIITWDSSEYIGMAKCIGKENMTSVWIGHRGLAFPLLLRTFINFGNGHLPFLFMLYIFYIIMIISIYKIFEKLNKDEFFNKKCYKAIFIISIIFLVILNPMIFGYYHTILTEFVSIAITILMCYLCFNWLDFNWNENKKQIIIYAIIFAILAVFIYHVKQSLIPIMLVSLLIASIISVIERWKLSNILVRIFTMAITAIALIISIIIWNNNMTEINASEQLESTRIKNKIISGITELKKICDEETVDEISLENMDIKEKDKEEIKKIKINDSEYKKFKIFKDSNDKYFVYYTKDDYSFKEQILFYLKVMVTSPSDIIKSYSKNYFNIIFTTIDHPMKYFNENYIIPIRIFSSQTNIEGINPKYEEYIEEYKIEKMNHNGPVAVFNRLEFALVEPITIFTKFNLYILLPILILMFSTYLFIRKKISIKDKRVMELIIILYTTSYGIIMPYVVLNNLVDRYIMPGLIPMYLADIVLIILIAKNIIKKSKKMHNKKK